MIFLRTFFRTYLTESHGDCLRRPFIRLSHMVPVCPLDGSWTITPFVLCLTFRKLYAPRKGLTKFLVSGWNGCLNFRFWGPDRDKHAKSRNPFSGQAHFNLFTAPNYDWPFYFNLYAIGVIAKPHNYCCAEVSEKSRAQSGEMSQVNYPNTQSLWI
jgi:hypothetical protein